MLRRPPSGASASFAATAAAAAASTSAASAAPSAVRPGLPRRLSANAGSRSSAAADPFGEEDDDDDPFGSSATQPLDDADEPSPRPLPPGRASSLSRSASGAGAATAPVSAIAAVPARSSSNTAPSAGAAGSSHRQSDLSGLQRQQADELQFLLDGLQPSEPINVRATSAANLLRTVLGVQSAGADGDDSAHRRSQMQRSDLVVMRSCDAFSALADAMPDPADIARADNELFATLFAGVSLVASQEAERSNAACFSTRGAELLFTLATSASHDSATTSTLAPEDSSKDDAPSAAYSTTIRQKRRPVKPTVTASDLSRLLLCQQTELLDQQRAAEEATLGAPLEAKERSRQLHLQGLVSGHNTDGCAPARRGCVRLALTILFFVYLFLFCSCLFSARCPTVAAGLRVFGVADVLLGGGDIRPATATLR